MNLYKIQQWNPIMIVNKYYPCLYIYPNLQLINILDTVLEVNLQVKVMDSKSPYDNKYYTGTCKLSQDTFGFRPNFQKETNLVAIVLDTNWEGYPLVMGDVYIDMEKFKTDYPSLNSYVNSDNDNNVINNRYMVSIAVIILIIVIIYFLVFDNNQKKINNL